MRSLGWVNPGLLGLLSMNIHNHFDGVGGSGTPSHSPVKLADGRLTAGDRAELAKPIKVVELLEGTVHVQTDGIVSDHDETISIGTGEHVHDGHVARFAQGLSIALLEYHQDSSATPFLSTAHLARFVDTNSIFSPPEWVPYKKQSGKSEDQVLRGMLRVAFERFNIDEFEFDALLERFSHHAGMVLKHGFHDFMQNVTLDRGLARAFETAKQEGIPIAVCSASQEHVVIETLKHFELKSKDLSASVDVIDVVIGNAVKKVDSSTFCGADIARACKELEVKPSQAVMFGDSIGDVAAAARAGIGTIFICVREPEMMHSLKNEIESFQNQDRYNKELVSRGDPITVYLVSDFGQVEIEGRIPTTENKVVCAINMPRIAKGA
jgi:beta-phosphoglucomutase-like phosphatase (HAD superfamily)